MNRLILIGNGFDLAHGMKTRYTDFFYSYLRNGFEQATMNTYKNELFTIHRNRIVALPDFEKIASLDDLLIFTKPKPKVTFWAPGAISQESNHSHTPFDLSFTNPFIERIATTCNTAKWVDIENEYYQSLKHVLKNGSGKGLPELNKAMRILTEELNTFFGKQIPENISQQYSSLFTERIYPADIVTTRVPELSGPSKILILNFNYTDTVDRYFKNKTKPIPINSIHGRAHDSNNPIIFGFGDELDEDYPAIESQINRGSLEYIKSFAYSKTSNYHDIVRFIESGVFQVYIVGHSCGLSDRTMLNMIFEHKKCVSIKIFYHQHAQDNNFRTITEEISRHFRNKGEMRKKIVPFNRSTPMPQVG